MSDWSVYILRCGDGTLYTGIAKDVAKRLAAHENGKGAKYTKHRRPLTLAYQENGHTRSSALKREHTIKRMSRAEKLDLVADYA